MIEYWILLEGARTKLDRTYSLLARHTIPFMANVTNVPVTGLHRYFSLSCSQLTITDDEIRSQNGSDIPQSAVEFCHAQCFSLNCVTLVAVASTSGNNGGRFRQTLRMTLFLNRQWTLLIDFCIWLDLLPVTEPQINVVRRTDVHSLSTNCSKFWKF
jgi:hypothetical protein